MDWAIKPAKILKGEIKVPSDKSISHRAIMFGVISGGKFVVNNFLRGEDCLCTLNAFSALGADIKEEGDMILINGKGLRGLEVSSSPIYLGNSGTSMRIMSGILAGQNFPTILEGDESLSKRPMNRIIDPLNRMGAIIESEEGGLAPLRICAVKDKLTSIDYSSPVASAQVKSSVLAAGLYAEGTTSVTEPYQSRDHTERMLKAFGADISQNGLSTEIKGLKELIPVDINVPGDISSAAFFIVGALLVKDADVTLQNVGINPTRRGIIDVLKRMGADIAILNISKEAEPSATLRIKRSELKGATVEPSEIPLLIDEIPVLCIAAAMAEGVTRIKGISELKVKETDRVKGIVCNLSKLGAQVFEDGDDLVISGGIEKFISCELDSGGDHRTAMSMAVAALVSDGECCIKDTGCVETSYPGFLDDMFKLTQ